jgi:hypothetical protein
MSLLPYDASFHERVADLFAAFRGRGVALSALDVELVDAWAKAGAPFEVVARGIRKAAEGALFDATEDDRGLRSLTACARLVSVELDKFNAATTGKAAPPEAEPQTDKPSKEVPLHLKRHRQLKAALRRAAKDNARVTAAALRIVETLHEPDDFDGAERNEMLAQLLLLRALPLAERRALLQEAHDLVQKSPAMSARARRESRRLHRAALLRRALDLPAFW